MLALLGANHRSAPVALRERLAFAEASLPRAFEQLFRSGVVHEAMILSTCNRVEILVRSNERAAASLDAVRSLLIDMREISREELDRYSYQLSGDESIRHLFRVASGLDSMILGEPQILGQVKEAFRVAREYKAVGTVLDRLFQHCIVAARRVRTETGISRNAVSVAFAAVKLAEKIFGDLTGRRALLLGAGKMSDLVCRHLMSSGVAELIVASRTYNHAVARAEQFGGRAVHWDDGIAALAHVDIVVSCTGAPRQILDKQDVAKALRGRRAGSLFLIDIAVPRDIDPGVNDLDNVYLYDIDALQGLIESNLEERRKAADLAQAIIGEEAAAFSRWRQSQELAPIIVSLRETLLELGQHEVERFRRKLGPMTERQQRGIEELTRALVQKILHRPIRHLHQSVERGTMQESAAIIQEIFAIEPARGAAKPAAEKPASEGSGEPDAPGPTHLLRGGKGDS